MRKTLSTITVGIALACAPVLGAQAASAAPASTIITGSHIIAAAPADTTSPTTGTSTTTTDDGDDHESDKTGLWGLLGLLGLAGLAGRGGRKHERTVEHREPVRTTHETRPVGDAGRTDYRTEANDLRRGDDRI